jgi:hypothetical protein
VFLKMFITASPFYLICFDAGGGTLYFYLKYFYRESKKKLFLGDSKVSWVPSKQINKLQ